MTRLRQSMQCSMFRLGVFVFFAFNNKKRSLSRRWCCPRSPLAIPSTSANATASWANKPSALNEIRFTEREQTKPETQTVRVSREREEGERRKGKGGKGLKLTMLWASHVQWLGPHPLATGNWELCQCQSHMAASRTEEKVCVVCLVKHCHLSKGDRKEEGRGKGWRGLRMS